MKRDALQKLVRDSDTRIYEARIKPGIKPETVLMEGKGFSVAYGDIVDAGMRKSTVNPEWIKRTLRERGEMILVSMAAERDGADVSAQLNRYLRRKPAGLVAGEKNRGSGFPTTRPFVAGTPIIRKPDAYPPVTMWGNSLLRQGKRQKRCASAF